MPNRTLALDIGGDRISAIVVESSFRSYEIVRAVEAPKDPEADLGTQVAAIVAENDLAADQVVSVLPSRAVAHRLLDLPFRDRKRLLQTVPFELEAHLPMSLEDGVTDFEIVGPRGEETRVFAAWCPSTEIAAHLETLRTAGLDPAVVDFGPLCALNVVRLSEDALPEEYAVLRSSPSGTALGIWYAEELRAFRAFDANVVDDVDRLADSLVWTLLPQRSGTDPLPLFVPDGVAGRLREILDPREIEVREFSTLSLRHLKSDEPAFLETHAAAIGAAMREPSERPTLGVNFRQGEFAYHRDQREIRQNLVRLGWIAAAVVLLFFTAEGVRLWSYRAELDAADRQIRSIFHTVLPGERAVDEASQLEQALADLQRRREQFGTSGGGAVSILDVLREISSRAPQSPRMDVEEFGLDAGAARIRGKTQSFEAVEEIRQAVASSPLFDEVEVKDPRTSSGGGVTFRLNVYFGARSS